MALNERPVWLTVVATLGAIFLGFAALCLGGFGACVALFFGGEGGGMFSSDALWVWGILIGAVLCAIAAVAILVWVLKKPKPRPIVAPDNRRDAETQTGENESFGPDDPL